MSVIEIVAGALLIVASLVIILVVLAQDTKEQGLTSAIGGGYNDSFYGKNGSNTKDAKLNKTQKWLIEEVKKLLPETYLDTSNLYKIMTGEIKSNKIEAAINEVLDINYTQNAENVNS